MKFLFLACMLCSVHALIGQKPDTLTNQNIIQLTKAGLGKDIVVAKIKGSFCKFDLTTEGLINLKKASVSDDVIGAMISKVNNNDSPENEAKNTKPKATPKEQVQNGSALTPGIYYCKGNPCNYQELEASVYSESKTNVNLLAAYGGKTKFKATLSTSSANTQLEEKAPVFYFYFNEANLKEFGSSMIFGNATSPNEFILIKFTLSKNKSSREVVTGSYGAYAGFSAGIDEAYKVKFKYEKVANGVYKVYFEKPLESGEYAFMFAGGSASSGGQAPQQKVYDFGVK